MVLIKENLEKATIWQPVKLACRVTDVPHELCWPSIEYHGTPLADDPNALALQWVKINDLSPLWPVGHFRTLMMANAKRFVRDMLHQRSEYHLKTDESDILICGPYRPKRPTGNMAARGWFTDEYLVGSNYDFVIHAWFVAKYGRIPEVRSSGG